ncbi:cittilin family RiPP precursor [Streptomyces sp. NPDC048491]|uniref:cittilin family RiPP precursor n=1 Tax=unclassified Streptomyces TaxID=2593676 RepID=UPI0034378209
MISVAERSRPDNQIGRPAEKEIEMRKLILTGALFARLSRKDRLTKAYIYY